MKTTLLICVSIASFLSVCVPLPAQVSSNKFLVVGANNVLRPNSTNFFATNIIPLTNALAAAGFTGGGGSSPTNYHTLGGTNVIVTTSTGATGTTNTVSVTGNVITNGYSGAVIISNGNLSVINPGGNAAYLTLQGAIMGGTSQTIGSSPAGLNIGPVLITPAAEIEANSGDLANWLYVGGNQTNEGNLVLSGAVTASAVTANIAASTNASGNSPLFSTNSSPFNAAALTNLNAASLTGAASISTTGNAATATVVTQSPLTNSVTNLLGTNVTALMAGDLYSNSLHFHSAAPVITMLTNGTGSAVAIQGTWGASILPGSHDAYGQIIITNGSANGTNTQGAVLYTNLFANPYLSTNYTVTLVTIALPGVSASGVLKTATAGAFCTTNQMTTGFTVISTGTDTALVNGSNIGISYTVTGQ
jgi:hypothetical protein